MSYSESPTPLEEWLRTELGRPVGSTEAGRRRLMRRVRAEHRVLEQACRPDHGVIVVQGQRRREPVGRGHAGRDEPFPAPHYECAEHEIGR